MSARFRAPAAIAAAALITVGTAGLARADTVTNSLDNTVDVTVESMPLTTSGPAGTTTLTVLVANGDGDNGCNIDGSGETLKLNVLTGDASVATVSPTSVSFTGTGANGSGCGVPQTLTVTPHGVGTTTISVSVASNTTGSGTYDLRPATFAVTVAPPANTAPSVTVGGVAESGSYALGSVPSATCSVTDSEDGPSSPAATLSAITGPDATHGIGSQTATCSYTDAGGLTATTSATYTITDGTAPVVTPVLSPATPDGADGWYRGPVTLTWQVTEAQSPSTLTTSGCGPVSVSADQPETAYSCTATSAGGTTGPVTVSVKRDGTAPAVSVGSVSGTAGNDGWYTSDVAVTFEATDALSGPSTRTGSVTSSGEGSAVVVESRAFSDVAGNTTPAGATSKSVKVDKGAPVVGPGVVTGGTAGTNGWYTSDVTVSFAATDGVSGPSTQTGSVTSSGEGSAVVVESPAFSDVAGNTTPAGATSKTVKIDKSAPAEPVLGDSALASSGTAYFGSVPAGPTSCTSSDAQSGITSCTVTAPDSPGAVGTHTYTAKATNGAGLTSTSELSYTVLPWTMKGFYAPVDLSSATTTVYNTVKGGSTVPLKFELFAGSTELTSTAVVKPLGYKQVSCSANAALDDVELTTTGGTSLRYDTTAGQYVYNWQVPKVAAGTCYAVTVATDDSTAKQTAYFKTK